MSAARCRVDYSHLTITTRERWLGSHRAERTARPAWVVP